MGKTTRFGFGTYGGPDGGNVTDDGSQFSYADKIALDKILSALEAHNHKGGDVCPDPTAGPQLTLSTSGGVLRPGTTYFYRSSHVDRYGLESAASAEVSVTTAAAALPPSQPVLTTDIGGVLPVGVYHYGLTQVGADGNETMLGPLALVNVLAGSQKAVIEFPPLPAGSTFSVWRLNPNAVTFYVSIARGVTSAFLVDDGTVFSVTDTEATEFDPSLQPPSVNLSSSSNKITAVVGDAALVGTDGGPIKRWRLYRTTQSGTYAASSLVTELTTTVNADGTGGLLSTIVDVGATPVVGKPLDASQCLQPSVKIVSGGVGSGAFVLQSTSANSGRHWRVVATADGALFTLLAPGVAPPVDATRADFFLMSANRTSWRVAVDDNGHLLTDTAVPPGAADTVFLPGAGPLIGTQNPTVEFVLGVTDDGALTTTLFSLGVLDLQFDSTGQPIRNVGPLRAATPVSSVTVTADTTGVHVSWTAPTQPGVTGYLLTATPSVAGPPVLTRLVGSSLMTATFAYAPAIPADLVSSTEYVISVTTKGDQGDSPAVSAAPITVPSGSSV